MIRCASSDLSPRPLILRPISGTAAKGDNVVEIESQRRVNIANKRLHILLGALIERKDSKGGTATAETLEDSLTVFDCGMAVVGGGDNAMDTA